MGALRAKISTPFVPEIGKMPGPVGRKGECGEKKHSLVARKTGGRKTASKVSGDKRGE